MPMRRAGDRRRRGAVALEYILIIGLVAIGLIAAFRIWGKTIRALFEYMAWDSSGALVEKVSLAPAEGSEWSGVDSEGRVFQTRPGRIAS